MQRKRVKSLKTGIAVTGKKKYQSKIKSFQYSGEISLASSRFLPGWELVSQRHWHSERSRNSLWDAGRRVICWIVG